MIAPIQKAQHLTVTRKEIINGVHELIQAIKTSGLIVTLRESLSAIGRVNAPAKTSLNVAIIRSLQQWQIAAHQFSPAAQHIAEVMELADLANPNIVASLLGSDDNLLGVTHTYVNTINYAYNYLPKIAKLLENASTNNEDTVSNDRQPDLAKFSVVAVDDNDGFVTPSRLVNLIESTEKLYEVCAILNDSSETRLRIVAADSGSDVSLTFLGDVKVITCLLGVFTTIYRAVLFFPEMKRVERTKAVAQQLPVLAQIGELEQEGKIDHEVADRLRHDLGVGVDKHISAHAYVPEADTTGIPSLRALMAPETKLLTGSTTSDTQNAVSEASQFSNLSPAEQQEYNKLIAKIQLGAKANGTDTKQPEDDITILREEF